MHPIYRLYVLPVVVIMYFIIPSIGIKALCPLLLQLKFILIVIPPNDLPCHMGMCSEWLDNSSLAIPMLENILLDNIHRWQWPLRQFCHPKIVNFELVGNCLVGNCTSVKCPGGILMAEIIQEGCLRTCVTVMEGVRFL